MSGSSAGRGGLRARAPRAGGRSSGLVWATLAALLLGAGCGPDLVVEDVSSSCSPGSCRVAFWVEARRPQVEDAEFEVTVLYQRQRTSALSEAGRARVRVRPLLGERVRVETKVDIGLHRGGRVVVRRVRR